MAQRWYRAYCVYGSVKTYVERISKQVRQYDLGDILPRVCYERPGRKRRGNRQFYLFVGINSEIKAQIPEQIDEFLTQVLRLRQHIGDFSFEDIKTMVSSEIDIEDYARKIIYTPPPPPDFDVPFDFTTHSEMEPSHDGIPAEAFNQLLYWASTVGSGTWNSFKTMCHHFLKERSDARHIFRRLRLLGHVEYYDHGKKWTVCPPCLAQVSHSDYEQPHHFLAGQRSQKFIQQLQELADVDILPQIGNYAPDCVCIKNVSHEHPAHILQHSGLVDILSPQYAGEASYRLASILPDLEGYQNSLILVAGIVPSFYATQKWHHNQFHDCAFQHETGFYHFSSKRDEGYAPHFTLFYDASAKIWQQGDWYGLRYLARFKSGEHCNVFYDPSQSRIALPADYRWPDLYERALVLASGCLPERRQGWLYYKDVSPVVMHILTQKLFAKEVDA